MVELARAVVDELVAAAYDSYPYECCGLLAGPPDGHRAETFARCRNTARSARVFTVEPLDHLHAELAAEAMGWEIVGVAHSHTHTEPYPSATDVDQAPDPGWHYVIVGLKRESPEIRSYRIVDGEVSEEPVTIV